RRVGDGTARSLRPTSRSGARSMESPTSVIRHTSAARRTLIVAALMALAASAASAQYVRSPELTAALAEASASVVACNGKAALIVLGNSDMKQIQTPYGALFGAG